MPEQGSERERLYDAERSFRDAIADGDDDRALATGLRGFQAAHEAHEKNALLWKERLAARDRIEELEQKREKDAAANGRALYEKSARIEELEGALNRARVLALALVSAITPSEHDRAYYNLDNEIRTALALTEHDSTKETS